MRIIICGAGHVGYSIASYLVADGHDVVVIDDNPERIRHINDTLDAQGIVAYAWHPETLEKVHAREADMLVAVYRTDEYNMVTCQVAHSLFQVPIKIARIRDQAFLDPKWSVLFSPNNLPIDYVISPEIEVAKSIAQNLQVPGATFVMSVGEGLATVVGLRCSENAQVSKAPIAHLANLFPHVHMRVLGISRQGRPIFPTPDLQIMPGDEVFLITAADMVEKVLACFGLEERESQSIVILGGGMIGTDLLKILENSGELYNLKVIERDPKQADQLARAFPKVLVLCGDALDRDVLKEAGVPRADVAVSIMNDDENNILSALLCKSLGVQSTITLVNKHGYLSLLPSLGLDVVVDPRAITVSYILRYIRRSRVRSAFALQEGFSEVMEIDVSETAQAVGLEVQSLEMSGKCLLGGVVRDGVFLVPEREFFVKVGDRLVFTVLTSQVSSLETMFAESYE